MRRGIGAAPTPRLPSSASELRWAIDEFQGGLRRSGPYRPDGLETRLDWSQHIPLGAEPPQQIIGMNDASASRQIDAIVRKTTGWRGERLGQLRALIRGADPRVIEEVKWKKPSRPEGVPVWSHDGIVCIGEALKNAVRLTFPKGAQLKDPKGLFNTRLDSKTVRAIDFHEGDTINASALKALIVRGARLNRG
jgi:hypothetical protein